MKCHYCSEQATGINYRPKPDLSNTLTCPSHRTTLYVPFAQSSEKHQTPYTSTKCSQQIPPLNEPSIKFDEILDTIIGQFYLMKSEYQECEQQMRNLSSEQAQQFQYDFQLTNPYMILRKDRQMFISLLLKNIHEKLVPNQRILMCSRKTNITNFSSPLVNKSHKKSFQSPYVSK